MDAVDATGDGDVDMRRRGVTSDGGDGARSLVGATGRRLRLNPAWRNESGEWRVGAKRAWELMARPLIARQTSERAEKHGEAVAALTVAAEREVAAARGAGAGASSSSAAAAVKSAEKRVKTLKAVASGLPDDGPVWDVVAWQESAGGVWRVAVDSKGDGDLTSAAGFADYRLERQWGYLGDASLLLSYAVNVYDDGDVVSIVTDSGSHGTHVAGIVAAWHPHHGDLNGVAPGAQLVTVKIGDNRLGGMETGTGLTRALEAVRRSGAAIINMSFGEGSARAGAGATSGRFMELATTLVRDHNVIFVSSAGNAGPALTTAGAPGAVHPHILGIGAAATASMMADQYSLRRSYAAGGADVADAPPSSAKTAGASSVRSAAAEASAPSRLAPGHERASDTNHTWSSRGPAVDGALGVSICAPGAAITCVPSWLHKLNDLYNGTSMASPNAAGCIALVLSALSAQRIPWNAGTVRRALEASAAPLPSSLADTFGTGYGLIQTASAYEHLLLQEALRRARVQASSRGEGHVLPVSPAAAPPGVGAGAGAGASAAGASADAAQWLPPLLEVVVANGGVGPGEASDRGIYLRDAAQCAAAQDATLTLRPVWPKHAAALRGSCALCLCCALPIAAPPPQPLAPL